MKLFDNLYELSDAISSLRNSRNIWRLPSIILFLFLTAQLFYLSTIFKRLDDAELLELKKR